MLSNMVNADLPLRMPCECGAQHPLSLRHSDSVDSQIEILWDDAAAIQISPLPAPSRLSLTSGVSTRL
jgi:hypothetical protein